MNKVVCGKQLMRVQLAERWEGCSNVKQQGRGSWRLDESDIGSYGGVDALYKLQHDKPSHAELLRNVYLVKRHIVFIKMLENVLKEQPDHQWQSDLLDMRTYEKQIDGVQYILTVIDILSKFDFAKVLRDKTGSRVTAAFKHAFRKVRMPVKLQTDAGKEFLNRPFQNVLKQHNVYHFITYNEGKASIVERFNRTLKSKLWRFFTANNTHRYVDVLHRFIEVYNDIYHRSIKMAQNSVTPEIRCGETCMPPC